MRASCGVSNTEADVDALLEAVAAISDDARSAQDPPVPYEQDPRTGDFWPVSDAPGGVATSATPALRAPGLALRRPTAGPAAEGRRQPIEPWNCTPKLKIPPSDAASQ